jgi:flagellin
MTGINGFNQSVSSMFASRSLRKNTKRLNSLNNQLSTGNRLTSAAMDAAGISIVGGLDSDIRGLDQATRNIGDGISMLNTAESAMSAVGNNLQRVRELTVQANNGTLGEDERNAIQNEINQLTEGIQDTVNSAQFNDKKLLDGSSGTVPIQAGPNDGDQVDLDLSFNADPAATGAGTLADGSGFPLSDLNVGGSEVSVSGNGVPTANSLDGVDAMLDNVSEVRSDLGATSQTLESRAESNQVQAENLGAARSRIRDTDYAKSSSEQISSSIRSKVNAAMLSQINLTSSSVLDMLP